jgi:hypothetical protein
MDEAVTDFEEWESEDNGERESPWYDVPEKMCPICSMLQFCDRDLRNYLRKLYGISDDEVFAIVKAANKRRKKLYDSEYVMYVLTQRNLRMEELVADIKAKFPTYKQFRASWR